MLAAVLLLAISVHANPISNNTIEANLIETSEKKIILRQGSQADCQYKYFYDQNEYKRTAILTIKGLPTNLAYDPTNNELHFTLIDVASLQNEETQTKMDQYVLKDGQPIKLTNVNGQAAAVDTTNSIVYIATDDGLKTLSKDHKAVFHSFKDEDIVQLFKTQNNFIYAVIYPDNEVYKIDLDKNEKIKVANVPCAYILAVDHDENIFYECDSKMTKVLLKGYQESIEFVGLPQNAAKAMAVDEKGRVILAANDGLYHLSPDNVIPKKLLDLDVIPSGIAIHDNDMFLATNNIIYHYKPCA